MTLIDLPQKHGDGDFWRAVIPLPGWQLHRNHREGRP
jgi:hypothetical protein